MANKAIGTLGTIPSLTIGGRVFTDLTNLIQLIGYCDTTGSGNINSDLRRISTGASYAPSGTTFSVKAVKLMSGDASGCVGRLLYSDASVGIGVATAFTTPIYEGNSSSITGYVSGASLGSSYEAPSDFTIASGKYGGWANNGAGKAVPRVFGYEA